MSAALEQLRRHPSIWRRQAPPASALTTGFPALDEVLPDAGWPMGALTEILVSREGVGELRLVLPALAELGARVESDLAVVEDVREKLRAAQLEASGLLDIERRVLGHRLELFGREIRRLERRHLGLLFELSLFEAVAGR